MASSPKAQAKDWLTHHKAEVQAAPSSPTSSCSKSKASITFVDRRYLRVAYWLIL